MRKRLSVILAPLALIGCSEAPTMSSASSGEPSSSAPSSSSVVSSSLVSSSSSSKSSTSSYVPMEEGDFVDLFKDFAGFDFDFVAADEVHYLTEAVSSTLYEIEETGTREFLNEHFEGLHMTAYDGVAIFNRPEVRGLLDVGFNVDDHWFWVDVAFSENEIRLGFKEAQSRKTLRYVTYSGPLTGTWAEDVRNTLLEQGNCYCK